MYLPVVPFETREREFPEWRAREAHRHTAVRERRPRRAWFKRLRPRLRAPREGRPPAVASPGA
jgi:hypothetical protein